MIVYRIGKRKRPLDVNGTGAALYPGRWNKKGTPVLYTGATKEIALLNNTVHIPPLLIPELDILRIEIPYDSITELKATDLPSNLGQYPAPVILPKIGEQWVLEGKTIALKVPVALFTRQ